MCKCLVLFGVPGVSACAGWKLSHPHNKSTMTNGYTKLGVRTQVKGAHWLKLHRKEDIHLEKSPPKIFILKVPPPKLTYSQEQIDKILTNGSNTGSNISVFASAWGGHELALLPQCITPAVRQCFLSNDMGESILINSREGGAGKEGEGREGNVEYINTNNCKA